MSQEVGGPRITLNTGHSMPLVGFGTYKVGYLFYLTLFEPIFRLPGKKLLTLLSTPLWPPVIANSTLQSSTTTSRSWALLWRFAYFRGFNNNPSFWKLLPKHGLKREDIFITTKIWPAPDDNLEKVPQVIEDSLKSLKTR